MHYRQSRSSYTTPDKAGQVRGLDSAPDSRSSELFLDQDFSHLKIRETQTNALQVIAEESAGLDQREPSFLLPARADAEADALLLRRPETREAEAQTPPTETSEQELQVDFDSTKIAELEDQVK